MAQIARSGKFQLFNYGSSKANRAAYGTPSPPDILELYGTLGACRVHACLPARSCGSACVRVE